MSSQILIWAHCIAYSYYQLGGSLSVGWVVLRSDALARALIHLALLLHVHWQYTDFAPLLKKICWETKMCVCIFMAKNVNK